MEGTFSHQNGDWHSAIPQPTVNSAHESRVSLLLEDDTVVVPADTRSDTDAAADSCIYVWGETTPLALVPSELITAARAGTPCVVSSPDITSGTVTNAFASPVCTFFWKESGEFWAVPHEQYVGVSAGLGGPITLPTRTLWVSVEGAEATALELSASLTLRQVLCTLAALPFPGVDTPSSPVIVRRSPHLWLIGSSSFVSPCQIVRGTGPEAGKWTVNTIADSDFLLEPPPRQFVVPTSISRSLVSAGNSRAASRASAAQVTRSASAPSLNSANSGSVSVSAAAVPSVTSDPTLDGSAAAAGAMSEEDELWAPREAGPTGVAPMRLDVFFQGRTVGMIAAGARHFLLATTDGLVYSWGANEYGQLGHASVRAEETPRLIHGLERSVVIGIACGAQNCVAVTQKGHLFTWGRGHVGQLALGDVTATSPAQLAPRLVPSTPQTDGKKFVRVASGSTHCMALTDGGEIFCWGEGHFGQIGNGLKSHQTTPVRVESLLGESVVDIACGANHSLAATSAGRVFTWGLGMFGQLGHATRENQFFPRCVSELSDVFVAQVFAGGNCSGALSESGILFSWGYGAHGQLGLTDPSAESSSDPLENVLLPRQTRTDKLAAVCFGSHHCVGIGSVRGQSSALLL